MSVSSRKPAMKRSNLSSNTQSHKPFFLLVRLSQGNIEIRRTTDSFQVVKELIGCLLTTYKPFKYSLNEDKGRLYNTNCNLYRKKLKNMLHFTGFQNM